MDAGTRHQMTGATLAPSLQSWGSSLRSSVDVHQFEIDLAIWFYQFPALQLTALHIFHTRKTSLKPNGETRSY